jgi:hypothetical protein
MNSDSEVKENAETSSSQARNNERIKRQLLFRHYIYPCVYLIQTQENKIFDICFEFSLAVSSCCSIGGRMGEPSIGQTNSLVGGINYDIEALEEGITVDDIEALTRGRAEIIYDEIDSAGSPTDLSVEGTGPELSVGGQFKGGLQIRIH